jgi:phage terminase large subunit
MASQASEKIAAWRASPARMVRELFHTEPDFWQLEVLEDFPHNPRQAMKACKGPGKTTVLAWLCWNFLLCYLHPKIAAVSITGDNLQDGLWAEMAKWRNKAPLLLTAFEWTRSRIFAKDHPDTWFMSARTFPRTGNAEAQANTLAGIHADNCMFVLDESGGIPDAVMAAAEAGLANADPTSGKHAHLVQAGNPTHLEGPLYRACTSERHLWKVYEITSDPDDPKRTPRVSVQWAKQQIEKYGRDNPWVLVNVFGRFPPSSINALIGPDEVRDAMQRHLRPEDYSFAAKVLGVDVALYGDDASVICQRQGLFVPPLTVMRGQGPMEGAGRVAHTWRQWQADGCFIDATGGFGDPWAAALEGLNFNPIRVMFSGESSDAQYHNKRAEMYFLAADWIRKGGALPNDPELLAELVAHTYTFKGDRLMVMPKELVKAKLGRSPDKADAFVLTFAFPVLAGVTADTPDFLRRAFADAQAGRAQTDYDVFGDY